MKYYQYNEKVINDFGVEQVMFNEHLMVDRDISRGACITHGVSVNFSKGTICTTTITYKDSYLSEVIELGVDTFLTDLEELTEKEAMELLGHNPTISGYLRNLQGFVS